MAALCVCSDVNALQTHLLAGCGSVTSELKDGAVPQCPGTVGEIPGLSVTLRTHTHSREHLGNSIRSHDTDAHANTHPDRSRSPCLWEGGREGVEGGLFFWVRVGSGSHWDPSL